MIEDCVPASILALPTETNLDVVNPWFEKSLDIPGDVAEFGCYRGTMSIKYAYWLASARRKDHDTKRVFAFDTFAGFQIDDPSGGDTKKGAYAADGTTISELRRWGKTIPIVPMYGDARETCSALRGLLSFVWFDLDMAVLLEPVRAGTWPLITGQTIIGVDDYGRPECPSVKPWADGVEGKGLWRQCFVDHLAFIAFYRKMET